MSSKAIPMQNENAVQDPRGKMVHENPQTIRLTPAGKLTVIGRRLLARYKKFREA